MRVRPGRRSAQPRGATRPTLSSRGREADDTPRSACTTPPTTTTSPAVEVASMGVAAPAVRALPPSLQKAFEQVGGVYVAALPDSSPGSRSAPWTRCRARARWRPGRDDGERRSPAAETFLDWSSFLASSTYIVFATGSAEFRTFITKPASLVSTQATLAFLSSRRTKLCRRLCSRHRRPPRRRAAASRAYEDIVERPYRSSIWSTTSTRHELAPGRAETCRPSRTARTPSRCCRTQTRAVAVGRPSPRSTRRRSSVNYSRRSLALHVRHARPGSTPGRAVPAAHHGPLARRRVRGGGPETGPAPPLRPAVAGLRTGRST